MSASRTSPYGSDITVLPHRHRLILLAHVQRTLDCRIQDILDHSPATHRPPAQSSAQISGIINLKVLPRSYWLSNSIRPPSRCASCWLKCRPRPVPSERPVAVDCTRAKASNSLA